MPETKHSGINSLINDLWAAQDELYYCLDMCGDLETEKRKHLLQGANAIKRTMSFLVKIAPAIILLGNSKGDD